MAAFGKKSNHDLTSSRRDKRQTKRKPMGAAAYIRLGSFAARPCTVIDLSDTGFRISVDSVLVSGGVCSVPVKELPRPLRPGEMRRGNQIGAEFI